MSDIQISYASALESVAVAKSHGEKFFEQIVWQVENRAWEVLGYDSWDDMRLTEYGGLGVVAPAADRPELVSRLRKSGLTQKEIGGTLGVHESTASRHLANASSDGPETIKNSRGQERPTSYTRTTPSPEPAVKPAPKVDMASNFEQAITGMNLTLSIGDPQTDLTEAQRQLAIRELERIINRIKGEEP